MIAKVLSSIGRIVKVDPNGGQIGNSNHYPPAGIDSRPVAGDFSAHILTQKTGISAIVGFYDVKNDPVAAAGEIRIYSRDGAGALKAVIHLKNDGSMVLNGNCVITKDGGIEAKSIKVNGVELDGHIHSQGTYTTTAGPVTGLSGGAQGGI